MKISLTIDNAAVKLLMSKFSRSASKAHDSALSRATSKVQTELVDRTYEKINLKKKDIKSSMSVRGRMGEIEVSGKSVSLSRFLPGEPKKKRGFPGLEVKLWRDREKVMYEGAFAAYGKGGNLHVFKREGKERLPIKKLHGKGIRDMWEVPKFSQGIIEIAQDEYSKRFISSFTAFVEKELAD